MRRPALALAGLLLAVPAVPGQAAPAPTGLPLDLSTRLTMDCIAPGNAWAVADCGDFLKSTYVEETMPAPGKVEIGSTVFTWPSMALQTPDTMPATAQRFDLGGVKGWSSVALLCAFRSGDGVKGDVASISVRYADGTSERVPFRAYDWKAQTEKSAYPGVKVQTGSTVLFDEGRITKALAPLNPKKSVKSIEMPGTSSPLLLVWAVSLSNEKAPVKP